MGPSSVVNGGDGGFDVRHQERLHPGGMNSAWPARKSGARSRQRVYSCDPNLRGNQYPAVRIVALLVPRFLITPWRRLHYTPPITGASLVAINCSSDVLGSGHAPEMSAA